MEGVHFVLPPHFPSPLIPTFLPIRLPFLKSVVLDLGLALYFVQGGIKGGAKGAAAMPGPAGPSMLQN